MTDSEADEVGIGDTGRRGRLGKFEEIESGKERDEMGLLEKEKGGGTNGIWKRRR